MRMGEEGLRLADTTAVVAEIEIGAIFGSQVVIVQACRAVGGSNGVGLYGAAELHERHGLAHVRADKEGHALSDFSPADGDLLVLGNCDWLTPSGSANTASEESCVVGVVRPHAVFLSEGPHYFVAGV